MVYQDIQNENTPSQKQPNLLQPPLLDRFFSFLIDYLILSPFVSFFIYLFFKDAISFWRANPDSPEQYALLGIVIFSLIFLFSAMQAAFIYFWKATPGQYYVKIYIIFEGPNHLIFWRALLRQAGFWTTPFFFGIPWIAMLSHPKRQTFYDRLADCQIVSLKSNPEIFSFENESRYWRSLLATLILFVGFLLGSVVWIKYESIVHGIASLKELEKKNYFCSELKDVQVSQRLPLAIAMNIVGQLSNHCLDQEADFVLWKQKESDTSLAYFAKSLTEENKETEAKYLAQACEGKEESLEAEASMGCRLANSFLTGEFEEIYASLKKDRSLLADTLKYEFSLILNKDTEAVAHFVKLRKYDTHRLMKKYLLSEMLNEKQSGDGRQPASADQIYDLEFADELVDDL